MERQIKIKLGQHEFGSKFVGSTNTVCLKKWCSVYFENFLASTHWIFKSFFSPDNWDPYVNFEYKTISVQF